MSQIDEAKIVPIRFLDNGAKEGGFHWLISSCGYYRGWMPGGKASHSRGSTRSRTQGRINLAETYGKMVEYGKRLEDVTYQVECLRIPVIPFDDEHAQLAASFWKKTRLVGMSLGDRACLALALQAGFRAYTTEEAWLKCDTGVRVVKIRQRQISGDVRRRRRNAAASAEIRG